MLTKKEIEDIAIDEIKKHKLTTKIKFLDPKEFKNKAKLSPIINQSLKEGNTLEELNIPALVSHQKNTIYMSTKLIYKLLLDEPLSIQTRFIKSIILHEVTHLINKKDFQTKDFNTALRLEEETGRQFRRNYPGLAALGKRICKKYISQ